MQNKSHTHARCLAGFSVLLVTVGMLNGCVTAPRPVIIAAPPPPPVIYQPAPPVYQAPPPAITGEVQTAPAIPAQPQPPTQRLTDAQVIGILTAANNAEILEAQLALHISRHAQVRAYAQQMISDHSHMNNSLLALSNQLGFTPTQSPASQHLTQTEQQALTSLESMRGKQFDRSYITHQVATHRTVLNGINNILLPGTRHPRLRNALSQASSIIAAHLHRAQALQAVIH